MHDPTREAQLDVARDEEGETDKERTQRQLGELLGEVRAVIPGVQVLFAFLLAIPFAPGFRRVNDFQQTVYFVTLLLTVVSSACLMAPSAYHRVRFGKGDRPHIIAISNQFAIAGFVALGLATLGAIVFITDFLYGSVPFIVAVSAGVGVVLAVLWFALPLLRGRRDGSEEL